MRGRLLSRLIVSDATTMDAVTERGTAGENAVKAFKAGIDQRSRRHADQGRTRSGAADGGPSGSVLYLSVLDYRRSQPFVAVFFGNPYVPLNVPELPAMIETYDLSDTAELSAARAIAGEIAIGGKLPIALPGMFPVGHGLTRGVENRTGGR